MVAIQSYDGSLADTLSGSSHSDHLMTSNLSLVYGIFAFVYAYKEAWYFTADKVYSNMNCCLPPLDNIHIMLVLFSKSRALIPSKPFHLPNFRF